MVSSKKAGTPALRPKAAERKQRGRTDRSAMFPAAPGIVEMPAGYANWLTDIKTRIRRERLRVVLASNSAMLLLYWDIGQSIIAKQAAQGYGTRVIDRLAAACATRSPTCRVFRHATSNTCAPLPPPGRIGNLCNESLHN